jgi:AcrR family transcriptional regulator
MKDAAEISERPTRSNGRETRQHILKCAQVELEKYGPIKFNILRVIEESGVSRSSVYHHFGDRDGIIAAVEVERLISEIRHSNEMLRLALSAATSGKKVFELLEQALLFASMPEGRQSRAHRVAVIAAAQDIPQLQISLVENTISGDKYLAETLEIAQSQGLIEMSLPAIDIARFIASIFIGRITVDGLESEEVDASWVKTTVAVLRFLLNPQN